MLTAVRRRLGSGQRPSLLICLVFVSETMSENGDALTPDRRSRRPRRAPHICARRRPSSSAATRPSDASAPCSRVACSDLHDRCRRSDHLLQPGRGRSGGAPAGAWHGRMVRDLRLYRPDGTHLPHDECPMAVALKENRPVRGGGDPGTAGRNPHPVHPLPDAAVRRLRCADRRGEHAGRHQRAQGRGKCPRLSGCDRRILGRRHHQQGSQRVVTSWNRGAETIFGFRAEEMIGRSISVLFRPIG